MRGRICYGSRSKPVYTKVGQEGRWGWGEKVGWLVLRSPLLPSIQSRSPAHGMVLCVLTASLSLRIPPPTLPKLHHGHRQRCPSITSQLILNLVKLTNEISNHRHPKATYLKQESSTCKQHEHLTALHWK